MKKPGTTTRPSGTVRCVIYTRKSSEEGLEQEFNSLQAQREACEAFVKSQRHEGWVCVPDGYDDGGLSGATMERPALQQLLAEIQAGRVDIVVAYKVEGAVGVVAPPPTRTLKPSCGWPRKCRAHTRRRDAPSLDS